MNSWATSVVQEIPDSGKVMEEVEAARKAKPEERAKEIIADAFLRKFRKKRFKGLSPEELIEMAERIKISHPKKIPGEGSLKELKGFTEFMRNKMQSLSEYPTPGERQILKSASEDYYKIWKNYEKGKTIIEKKRSTYKTLHPSNWQELIGAEEKRLEENYTAEKGKLAEDIKEKFYRNAKEEKKAMIYEFGGRLEDCKWYSAIGAAGAAIIVVGLIVVILLLYYGKIRTAISTFMSAADWQTGPFYYRFC